MIERKANDINSLYALKFVMIIIVVIAHSGTFGKAYLFPLFSVAMPVFFMITGYFLGTTDEHGNLVIKGSRIASSLKKLALLFISGNAIYLFCYYLPWMLIHIHRSVPDDFIGWIFSWQFYCKMIIHGDVLNFTFWYINAGFWGLCLLFALYRIIGLQRLFFIIPILIIGDAYFGAYYYLNNDVPLSLWLPNRAIFTALSTLLIGLAIRKYEARLLAIWHKYEILTLAVLTITLYGEYAFLLHNGVSMLNIYAFLAAQPLATAIFISALLHNNVNISSFVVFTGKHLTRNIYIYHALVLMYLHMVKYLLCGPVQGVAGLIYDNTEFLITLPLSYLIAVAIYRLQNRRSH